MRRDTGITNIAKWMVSTVLFGGLMLGLGTVSFLLAAPLADDWALFTLLGGAVGGLILGVRYRRQPWLRVVSGVLLIFSIGFIVSLPIPRQPPEPMPEGTNRLFMAFADVMRALLLRIFVIASGLCLAISAITTTVVSFIPERKISHREYRAAAT